MTDKQKKLIFEYCRFKIGWGCKRIESGLNQDCIKSKNPVLLHCLPDNKKPCIYYYERFRDLDGNDIIEAVRIMESKGDMTEFDEYWMNKWTIAVDTTHLGINQFAYLLQNFFPLMAEWLEDRT